LSEEDFMSLSTDGFGTIIAALEAGGGGGTVIPDGGTIGGEYDGNVLCEGNVTVGDNLTVKGSLLILGNLTNSGGWAMDIKGDLIANNLYCDPDAEGEPPGNISVGGDLIFGSEFQFRQKSGGFPAEIQVGGNLTGNLGFISTGSIFASGDFKGSEGAYIYVNGSVYVYSIDISGASSDDPMIPAGSGGSLLVYGDLMVQDSVDAGGGYGDGAPAGGGGTVTVWGAVNGGEASISVRGGDAGGGDAGNGGFLYLYSNASVGELVFVGGDCSSDDSTHRSGSGGYLEVKGTLTVDNSCNGRGGDRYGSLSGANTLTPPNGGQVYVYGGAFLNDLFLEGGEIYTNNFAPHEGGRGGEAYIYGALFVRDDCQLSGGPSANGSGGEGGSLYVDGSAWIEDDLELNGGYSDSSTGGEGRDAGSVSVNGDLSAGDINLEGGNSQSGPSGRGGIIDIEGSFTVKSFLYLNGGPSYSANENHSSGRGGEIYCRDLVAGGVSLYLNGGERSGATLVGGSVATPNGGFVQAYGNVTANSIEARGGNVFTNYPICAGGEGGSLIVLGTLTLDGSLDFVGGSGVGPFGGGFGGSVSVRGAASFFDLYLVGGDANDSSVGGDAGTNGSCGNATFTGGLVARNLILTDGTGIGSAASATKDLILSGSVSVDAISMENRLTCRIRPDSKAPAVVRVNQLTSKTTFNNLAGVATGDLSAIVGNSILISGAGGSWSYLQGTGI
jgi:hypothetical protein